MNSPISSPVFTVPDSDLKNRTGDTRFLLEGDYPEELLLLDHPIREGWEDLPLVHPDRSRPKINLRKAWYHLRRLEKQKEKTSEVFHVFEALPWMGVVDTAVAFLSTERGKEIYSREPSLPAILDNHDALRRLPKGTLAHDYCDYMEREELSAAGLVAEYEDWRGDRPRINDKVEWYIDRLRDTHDILHMLTGIGRDALGEQCLGAFVFHQRRSIGHIFLAYVGGMILKTHVKGSKAPVMRAVRNCQQAGKVCKRIAEESILELLAMPTEEVRTRLNVKPSPVYQEVHRVWRSEGRDPYKVMAIYAK